MNARTDTPSHRPAGRPLRLATLLISTLAVAGLALGAVALTEPPGLTAASSARLLPSRLRLPFGPIAVLVLLTGVGGVAYGRQGKALAAAEQRIALLDQQACALREQLRLARAGLSQAEKLSALETLVAQVAHELNAPLASALLVLAEMQRRLEESQADPETAGDPVRFQAFLARQCHQTDQTLICLLRCADLIHSFQSRERPVSPWTALP